MKMTPILKSCWTSFKIRKIMPMKTSLKYHWSPSDNQISIQLMTYSTFETVGEKACLYFDSRNTKWQNLQRFPKENLGIFNKIVYADTTWLNNLPPWNPTQRHMKKKIYIYIYIHTHRVINYGFIGNSKRWEHLSHVHLSRGDRLS